MEKVILCTYGPGCFGCCGTEFTRSKKDMIKQVEINTNELKNYDNPNNFRERHGPLFKDDGDPYKMCRNVTKLKNGNVGCPLHPAQNKGTDYRKNYCYKTYWCPTMKKFRKWEDKKKNNFLQFIDSKNLDTYDYSVLIDSGKLLMEFETEVIPIKI